MKFIFFSYDGLGFSIAYKLLQEGNDVIVAQVNDNSELENGDKSEDPETKKRRLSCYDGILTKYPASEVVKKMKNIKNKDEVFIIFDFNSLWKYSEEVLKLGFKNGFFPTKKDYEMEKDRNLAKDIVKKYYPELEVAEVHEFKKVADGIQFLEESEDFWVLKGFAETADTVCPSTKVLELAKQQLIDTLNKDPKDYEKSGFILERRIIDPFEITPEAQFYNGELISVTVDIESKPMNAGDEGKQTGCAQNLIIQVDKESKIAKMAFPKYVYDLAKQHTGLFVWDASILFKDKPYFGEFCANRWGWDSFFTELNMCESVTGYFQGLINGINPMIYRYGTAVRGFNLDTDLKNKSYASERKISWIEEVDRNIWVYDMKMDKEDSPVNTGYWEIDLCVFTGAGFSIEDALEQAHKAREGFSFSNLSIRPKFDFMSKDYPTSIINRFEFAKEYFEIEKEDNVKEIESFN